MISSMSLYKVLLVFIDVAKPSFAFFYILVSTKQAHW